MWVCNSCGQKNEKNICQNCQTKRPDYRPMITLFDGCVFDHKDGAKLPSMPTLTPLVYAKPEKKPRNYKWVWKTMKVIGKVIFYLIAGAFLLLTAILEALASASHRHHGHHRSHCDNYRSWRH